ncbi:MAG: ATP-dependent helicase [Anaerolineae bacterium]|nr:ATP-dependent helicase [Anaerolineae bacterium]
MSTQFRPSQQQILDYSKGKMAVSAVPGAGKTFTLSHLAAKLVARVTSKHVKDEQEVLIVTFSNSAVNTIKARIADILQQQRGLLPYVGYRVRTLHGLAHDIVRERPALVGLADDFKIIDERVSSDILRSAVDAWLRASGDDLLMPYIDPEIEAQEAQITKVRRNELPELAFSVASSFIRQAKDRLQTPAMLREALASAQKKIHGLDLPLAVFGIDVYEAYSRSLAYRGAVDFDDLVRLALVALDNDKDFLKRLRKRWPYILEDEAQDSSLLQENMLRLLSSGKNWVRVGDPNQAINTTFTTANPKYLRAFLDETGVTPYTLAEAGRSAQPIIDAANALIHWAEAHPAPDLRTAFLTQDIQPTDTGDVQANPPAEEAVVTVYYEPGKEISPDRELDLVARSLEKWLPNNPDKTCAVLVPDNNRGFKLTELLRARSVDYEELLRSTTATRDTAEALRHVMVYLAAPMDASKLVELYRDVWWHSHLGKTDASSAMLEDVIGGLADIRTLEAFLFPSAGTFAFDVIHLKSDAADLLDDVEHFRQTVKRWLDATTLPIDQLVLTVGQDLFTKATEIALNYKIAQLLRGIANENPDWRLPQFAEELRTISQNERRFLGFDDAEQGYKPTPGQVTIATMHAAKGLEWDRVYLLAVNNYSFPSLQPFDRYYSEKWFLRPNLNLEAEGLAQLESLIGGARYIEGEATAQSRIDFVAERLRLLYVGITRAKRELIVTWNTGKGKTPSYPALPLVALAEYVSKLRGG